MKLLSHIIFYIRPVLLTIVGILVFVSSVFSSPQQTIPKLGRARSLCPTMLNYKVAADNGSMYNTPPAFAWYLSGLVFAWLKEQGGVAAMGKLTEEKKRTLYDFIDASGI